MRQFSCGLALACSVLACTSSADRSGSLQASPPALTPVSGGSQPAAPIGGATGEAAQGTTPPASGAAEKPGALPLAGAAAQADAARGSSARSGTTPAEDAAVPSVSPPPAPARLDNVLVFTRTTGFRHGSIEPGVEALRRLAQDNGFALERTEDPADFTDERLARYDAVVWLNTDSEVMDESARRAFERYIRAGGGWVGVHAAAATEYDWAWYGQLIGGAAYFRGHPAVQPAQVSVEIAGHASTQHLPQTFTLQDEWYSFRTNPRASVQVLMTLNESSYAVGDLAMGDHPIAWYHEFDGGRAWYTALGHPNELYNDSRFIQHLLGGIRWAAGVVP